MTDINKLQTMSPSRPFYVAILSTSDNHSIVNHILFAKWPNGRLPEKL